VDTPHPGRVQTCRWELEQAKNEAEGNESKADASQWNITKALLAIQGEDDK